VRLRPLVARLARPLLVLGGLGAIAYLLHQLGVRAVWDSLRALGWRLPIVLLCSSSMAAILDTLGWWVLLRDRRLPLLLLLRARLAGEAVNLTTPTASVGGEPLKAYLLRPHVPLAEGLASIVVDKTTVVAGQVLLLLFGLVLAMFVLPRSSGLVVAMQALCAVQIGALTGFILVQTLGIFGGGGRFLGRIGVARADRYQEGLDAVDRSLRRFYREHASRVLGSTMLHTAAWVSGALEIYLFLVFVGFPSSLVPSLIIEAFSTAVKFASFMIPASLGALEGGHVAAFSALGLGGATGLSYTLVRRLREAIWGGIGWLWLACLRERGSSVAGDAEAVAADDPR
jgi:glycosyltransferase 2 family protein